MENFSCDCMANVKIFCSKLLARNLQFYSWIIWQNFKSFLQRTFFFMILQKLLFIFKKAKEVKITKKWKSDILTSFSKLLAILLFFVWTIMCVWLQLIYSILSFVILTNIWIFRLPLSPIPWTKKKVLAAMYESWDLLWRLA